MPWYCGVGCAKGWDGDPNSPLALRNNKATNGQRLLSALNLVTFPLVGLRATVRTIQGFSVAESALILEARAILHSSEFAALRAAHQAGTSLSVNVGGRLIQYEAGWTYSEAMTLGQELFRLRSGTLGYGEASSYATRATQEAYDFAQRAGTYILGSP